MNGFAQTGVGCCGVGLLLAFGFAAPPAAEDLTAVVMKQARARQEKVKTLDVKLKQTEVLPAGSIARGNKAVPPTPLERTVLSSECRLVIQGNKLRYEDVTHSWRPNNAVQQVRRLVVWDGARVTTFYPKWGDSDDHAVAFIDRAAVPGSVTYAVWPLLMAFRGMAPGLATDDLRWLVPSDTVIPLRGELPRRRRFDLQRTQGSLASFWIDKHGLIWQKTQERGGQLVTKTDVRYERRGDFDAFPASWTTTSFSRPGVVRNETTLAVVEAKVNEPVAETEFTIQFPPGCVIHDNADRKEDVGLHDGSRVENRQPITDVAPTGDWLSRYRGPIGVCLAAVLVVVVAGCLTRLGKRKPGANPPSKSA
jgi:hypothetical protein